MIKCQECGKIIEKFFSSNPKEKFCGVCFLKVIQEKRKTLFQNMKMCGDKNKSKLAVLNSRNGQKLK